MNITINISVVPGREYQVSSPQLASISVLYNGMQIGGTGYNNRFIALAGVNTLVIVSNAALTGTVTVTEYMRNFYDPLDGQGGVVAFNEKWTGIYGFRPEWMGAVGNRLVTFIAGIPYIHNGPKNTFYEYVQDSVVAFPHNEAGNVIKTYDAFAMEGITPDNVHVRTEVPYVQSSDLVAGDFSNKEGVKYAAIYRDRLSPNTSGTVIDKLYKGDPMRGEVGKFQVVFSQPSSIKSWKFVNINYTPSTGQKV